MAYEKEAKALASKAGASDDDGDEAPSYDAVEDSAADELAALVGVKDTAAFKSALSDYVKACVERAMGKGE